MSESFFCGLLLPVNRLNSYSQNRTAYSRRKNGFFQEKERLILTERTAFSMRARSATKDNDIFSVFFFFIVFYLYLCIL